MDIMSLLPLLLMFVLLYFLMLRPQMRRAKEQKQMLGALQKGDEVVTSGGTLGRITKVERRLCDRGDRAQRGDHRAKAIDPDLVAQGHDQGAQLEPHVAPADALTRSET